MSKRKRLQYYPLEELKIQIDEHPDEDFISSELKTSKLVYIWWILQVIIALGFVYFSLKLALIYQSSRDHNEMAQISCHNFNNCGQYEMRDFPYAYFEHHFEYTYRHFCVKECPVIKNGKIKEVTDRPSKLLQNHLSDSHLVDSKYCFTDQTYQWNYIKWCDFPFLNIWTWAYTLKISESYWILGLALFTTALCITIIFLYQSKQIPINYIYLTLTRIVGLIIISGFFFYLYLTSFNSMEEIQLKDELLRKEITFMIFLICTIYGVASVALINERCYNDNNKQFQIISYVVQRIIKEEQLVIKCLLPGVSLTILILVWMYYFFYLLIALLVENPSFLKDSVFTENNIPYLLTFIFLPVFASFLSVIVYFVDHLTMMRAIRYFKKQKQRVENQFGVIDNEDVSIWRDFYILNTNIFWTVVEHTYFNFLAPFYFLDLLGDFFGMKINRDLYENIIIKLNSKYIYDSPNIDKNNMLFFELGVIGSSIQISFCYSISILNAFLFYFLSGESRSSIQFQSILAVAFSSFYVAKVCFAIYRSAFISCIYLMDDEALGINQPEIDPLRLDDVNLSSDPSHKINIIKSISSVRNSQKLANSIIKASFKDKQEEIQYNKLLYNNLVNMDHIRVVQAVADQIQTMEIPYEQKEILVNEMNNLKKLNENKEVKMSDINFQLMKKVSIGQQSKKSESQITNDILKTYSSHDELTKLLKEYQQNNNNNNNIQTDEYFQQMNSYNKLRNREINIPSFLHSQQNQHGENPSIESVIPSLAVFSIFNDNGYSLNLTNKKENIQNSESNIVDPLYLHQMQIVLSGQTKDLGYFCIVCKPHLNLVQRHNQTIDEIEVILTEQLKLDIQKAFNTIAKDEILITDVGFDNITGQFAVHMRVPEKDRLSVQSSISSNKQVLKHFDEVDITFNSIINHFKISPDLFDSRYNNDWKKQKKQKRTFTYRGAIEFIENGRPVIKKQPYYYPIDMQGYGINLSSFQNDNAEWISKEENVNTWIVLYNAPKGKNVASILIGDPSNHNQLMQGGNQYYRSQLIPDQAQYFGGSMCRITKQIFKGNEFDADRDKVYLADNVYSCMKYAEEQGVKIGDKHYQLIFQCRVNPFHVQSPISNSNIYTVDRLYSSNSIRPYRLLVKEIVPKKQR